MANFFTMPKLGIDMTEGRIVNWMVKEGSLVKKGELILEVETDKAANEIESPVDGRLAKIVHKAGDQVACNTVIAVFLDEKEDMPASIPQMLGEFSSAGNIEESNHQVQEVKQVPAVKHRISVTPSAKKMAQELGIDLAAVVSENEYISREDVQRAYDRKKPQVSKPELNVTRKPLTGIRKITAERMSRSANTTAQVALNLSVDASALIARREAEETNGRKISFNVLLAKAVSDALKVFPYMNSRLVDDEIWEIGQINIGIAVDTERGLYVPVLRDVECKNIEQLNDEYLSLVERAQSGKLNVEELEGGSFTITNLGEEHIESFAPVINLPECAILGVGMIMPKPVVENGVVVIKNMLALTLVFDHRLVDGRPAGKFLRKIKEIIENNNFWSGVK